MGEMERIADQLKRAYEGSAWHGPSVLEVLDGISPAQAARRPIAEAHSIWEIVLHMATWEDVVRRRALGEKFDVSEAENWPAVTATDAAAWAEAKARLEASHRALRATLATLPESRLDEPLVAGGNTGYVQLHGVVQHDLYHAGQIAVLKKAKAGAAAGGKPKEGARKAAARPRKPARQRRVAPKRAVKRARRPRRAQRSRRG